MTTASEKTDAFTELLKIMDDLREKCPWDRKQTLQTLRPLTVEETYELSEALLNEDFSEIKKELGDVLLHLVFYSKIASEKGHFDFGDVIRSLNEKLIFRHPHIYGEAVAEDEEAVKQNWEKLKLKEGNKSVLQGVPKGLPSMVKAHRIQEKAGGAGFDFPDAHAAWKKVEEEMAEFMTEENHEKRENELGDVLFSLINFARISGMNADTALEKTNAKFISRFQKMEQLAAAADQNFSDLTPEKKEFYWEEAKRFEN